MGTYSDMSAKAGTNISTMNSSLSSIKNISFDGVWSGDAFNAQSEGLKLVLENADNASADLEKFSQILEQLEQYKALKEKIDALTEEINSITIPNDPEEAAAAMNRKNSLIAERDKLITEKNKLRQTIEAGLATFKAIDSQISVINYNPEEHKEYLEYLEKLYEQFGSLMTTEEFISYLNQLGLGNLLPKNNSDIAHRGSHPGGIYENSLEAFIEAGLKGFWGCETDVRFDADGNLVCSHNAVKNGENPTSFSDYLDVCKQYGMTAIIDLKYAAGLTNTPDAELSAAIIEMIEEKGMTDSCVIQTNHFADLPYIRSQSDDVRIWLLSHGTSVTDSNIQLALENNVECINFQSSGNNSNYIKKITDAGIDACVWNVTTETGKQSCLNAGATYVMSDNVLGISPYQEGQTDFNAVKGNYTNTYTNSNYNLENLQELKKFLENTGVSNTASVTTANTTTDVDTSPSQYYDNYDASTNGTKNVPDGSYTGPILLANQGRLNYVRTDGVTVQESWCDINLENTPELAAFYQYDGDKVVEGTKISDMKYWVREDGVQMIGDYVAVATDVIARKSYGVKDNMAGWQGGTYNYGEVVETTLGKGIVMGICTEAQRLRSVNGDSFTNLEIYTLWNNSPYSATVRAKDYVPTNYANDPLLAYQD